MPDRRVYSCTIAVVLLVGFGLAPAFAEPSLAHARELYQSADYEQSLAVLEQLRDGGSAELTEVGTYKVFCLVALGRTDDAVRAVGAVVALDPFYQPPESIASPRVRAVFRDARRSTLPVVAQREYAAAKAAFDRRDPEATAMFERVLKLLNDPDATGPAAADLRVLAEGFRDLSRAFGSVPALPSRSQASSEIPVEPGPQRLAHAGAAVPTADEPGLTAPVALSQPMPRWTPPQVSSLNRTQAFEGILQVLIDERGSVADVRLQSSILPQYDAELLKLARTWKFKPAMRNGTPVPYTKVVQIRLTPAVP